MVLNYIVTSSKGGGYFLMLSWYFITLCRIFNSLTFNNYV